MARPKDRDLERLWRQRFQRHLTGGLSVTVFCAREGVSSATFYSTGSDASRQRQYPLPGLPPCSCRFVSRSRHLTPSSRRPVASSSNCRIGYALVEVDQPAIMGVLPAGVKNVILPVPGRAVAWWRSQDAWVALGQWSAKAVGDDLVDGRLLAALLSCRGRLEVLLQRLK